MAEPQPSAVVFGVICGLPIDCSCHDLTRALAADFDPASLGPVKSSQSGQLFSAEVIVLFFEPQLLRNSPLKNGHKRDCVLVSRAYFSLSQFFLTCVRFWLLFIFISKNPFHKGIK